MSKKVYEKTLNQESSTSKLQVENNKVSIEKPVDKKSNIRPGSFSELISQ